MGSLPLIGDQPASALTRLGASSLKLVLLPLQLLAAHPLALFLSALTAMLLRHSDVDFYPIDRIAFGLLCISVGTRAVMKRENLFQVERISWPMLALIGLAVVSVISQPFNPETWSLIAAKLIVPFSLFHIARLVFQRDSDLRRFEIFALVVLAYLSFTAIVFLVGANALIFPRYILDPGLGTHADRTRGPFLQAVANGVSLNMLGLLAFHGYRRGSARGIQIALLLASVPLSILATMTRAVWLSFAGSVIVLIFLSKNRRLQWASVALVLVGVSAIATLGSSQLGDALSDRLQERAPVDFRAAVYQGGWEMFLQRPLSGWGLPPNAGRVASVRNRVSRKNPLPSQHVPGIAG
jgi:O-antigen ligase